MNISEFCPLTSEAVAELLASRNTSEAQRSAGERRKTPRWPFPGTAELWIPDEDGIEHHALATSLDLSVDGVGIRCDEPLEPGLELAVALHEPEMSFHGRAVVRHCAAMGDEYLVGLQFVTADP